LSKVTLLLKAKQNSEISHYFVLFKFELSFKIIIRLCSGPARAWASSQAQYFRKFLGSGAGNKFFSITLMKVRFKAQEIWVLRNTNFRSYLKNFSKKGSQLMKIRFNAKNLTHKLEEFWNKFIGNIWEQAQGLKDRIKDHKTNR
jgi:hypothetical protein